MHPPGPTSYKTLTEKSNNIFSNLSELLGGCIWGENVCHCSTENKLLSCSVIYKGFIKPFYVACWYWTKRSDRIVSVSFRSLVHIWLYELWESGERMTASHRLMKRRGMVNTEQLLEGHDGWSWTKWSRGKLVTITMHLSMRNEGCNVGVSFWAHTMPTPGSIMDLRSISFWSSSTVKAYHWSTTGLFFFNLFSRIKFTTIWFHSLSKRFSCTVYFSLMLLTYCLSFPIPIWQGLRLWAIV